MPLRHVLSHSGCVNSDGPSARPLQVLDLPVGDLAPTHWGLTGRGVPDADSPDEAVFLPARNVLLLSKAMIWCHLHQVGWLASDGAHLARGPVQLPDRGLAGAGGLRGEGAVGAGERDDRIQPLQPSGDVPPALDFYRRECDHCLPEVR